MKYAVGEKVKIKTWQQMKKEYGVEHLKGWKKIKNVDSPVPFTGYMEGLVKALNNGRVLTVGKIVRNFKYECYVMKEIDNWCWSDHMIEGIDEDYRQQHYITDRFEIIDL